MNCEYRFICGEKDCGRDMEECRKLLVEKLTERESAMKRQKESFAQELAAAKEAEGGAEIHFLCDQRNCESCGEFACESGGYTTNIRHAANFHLEGKEFFENT